MERIQAPYVGKSDYWYSDDNVDAADREEWEADDRCEEEEEEWQKIENVVEEKIKEKKT